MFKLAPVRWAHYPGCSYAYALNHRLQLFTGNFYNGGLGRCNHSPRFIMFSIGKVHIAWVGPRRGPGRYHFGIGCEQRFVERFTIHPQG